MFRGTKQPCRNFKSGSCHYGDRCKFSHAINIQPQQQQQQQTNNTSRSNTNPFGFGGFAQQSKGTPSAFASVSNKQQQNQNQNQNQFKPFENKWTRSDTNAPSFSKQSNQQPQSAPANHTCTSSDGCKRQIVEDLENERPLWKLTCYGHVKHGPCDIVGDVSYEELRAAAYDDAKKGLSLLSVVERERNMLNSKLMEFDNMKRNPYVISPNTVTERPSPFPSPFPGINTNGAPASVQNNVPPSVSSFSQLGFSNIQGSSTSAVALQNNNFGQQSPPISSQTSGSFGANNLNFGAQGFFGNQQHMQPHGNASTFNGQLAFGNNLTASSVGSVLSPSVASNKSPIFSIGRNVADSLGGQTNVIKSEGFRGDSSIWLKEKWNPGEIPEEAPPDEFV